MILMALFACANTTPEPANEPATTYTPAGSSSSSNPNWSASTGSGNGNGGSNNNGGNEQNNDEDPDNTDPEDEIVSLNSGSIDIYDYDGVDPVPTEGRVIVATVCEGVTGLQMHAMSEGSVWSQEYWFNGTSSGDAATAYSQDDGLFLVDGAIDSSTVLWSEFATDKDSVVKLNGYSWNGDTVDWMVSDGRVLNSVCLAVMLHDDGTWKVCLPDDNSLGGGDIICDPAFNGQDMMPLFDQAFDEAWEAYCEQYDCMGDHD